MSKRTTIKFKDLINTVSKDEFESYYFSHSRKDTMLHFNIGNTVWDKYLHYYNIKKSKEAIYEIRKATNLEKCGFENPFQDVDKIKQSYIKINGSLENHYKKSIENLKNNNLKKYGVEYVSSLPEVINKRKQTISHIPDFYSNRSEKTFNTKLQRYGDGNYHNIEQMKKTNLSKYGVEYNFASDDENINGRKTQLKKWGHDNFNNRNKAKQTCIDKYGQDYYIKQIQLMLKSLECNSVSKPNKYFSAYLVEHCVPYETEFPLGNYIYDFKLGNYLVEIDPWATHSSSFAPMDWEPKSEYYHRNKTIEALNNNYTCVHIFDWVNIDAIVYGIISKNLRIVDTYKPVRHIYDIKEKRLTNKENENTVIIYDDGFEVIY